MKTRAFSATIVGTAGLVFLLAFLATLAPLARTDDGKVHREFVFVSFSQAPAATGAAVINRFSMAGAGAFDPQKGEAEGGGPYARFNNATLGVPKPILDSGTWTVTEFVSAAFCGHELFCGSATPTGVYDHITSGIVVLRINLISDVDGTVTPATLRLVCNVGAAGLDTGEPEGFVLTIDGAPFGPFTPVLVPAATGPPTPLGITHLGTLPRDLVRGNKNGS